MGKKILTRVSQRETDHWSFCMFLSSHGQFFELIFVEQSSPKNAVVFPPKAKMLFSKI
jgi:hypothetical protein